MTDINVGAITEVLTEKSDLDLGNTSPQIVDYIVEQQLPSAENNYTWYNKYKSGRVEQGGRDNSITTGSNQTKALPIEMSDKYYTINITLIGTGTSDTGFKIIDSTTTTTEFGYIVNSGDNNTGIYWEVEGMAAS